MNRKFSYAVHICIFSIVLALAAFLNAGTASADGISTSGAVNLNYGGPTGSLSHITIDNGPNVVPITKGQTVTATVHKDEEQLYVFYSDSVPTSADFIKFTVTEGDPSKSIVVVAYAPSTVGFSFGWSVYTYDDSKIYFTPDIIANSFNTKGTQHAWEKDGNGLYMVLVYGVGECTYSLSLTAPVEGADISFDDDPAGVKTGSDGAWSQTGFTSGKAYTVQALKQGYTVTPSGQPVTAPASGVNFTATPASYPSITGITCDKATVMCGMANNLKLTVHTSGETDGAVVGACLMTPGHTFAKFQSASSSNVKIDYVEYGQITDNLADITVTLPANLQPGYYEIMTMIPGLAEPAYLPVTVLGEDGSLPSPSCIANIVLSQDSQTNKQVEPVTVNVATANVLDKYSKVDTQCNVVLTKSDGTPVAQPVGGNCKVKDNKASIMLYVPELPPGKYRFQVTVNTKVNMIYTPVIDQNHTLIDVPLVAYKEYTVYDAATSNDITGFTVPGQSGASVIDHNNHTVSFSMPYGSDITKLMPNITVNGASITETSGTAGNFASPVTYTVTAQNGMRQEWTVTGNVYGESSSYKSITAYSIPNQEGTAVIDAVNQTITLEMPDGSDLSNLTAAFTLSAGAAATVNGTPQTSGSTANSFCSPVEYTVTAADGSTAIWKIYVICNARQFMLSGGNLDQTSGVTASVTISPTTGPAHDGTEMVVFQLMKGDLPVGITAIKRDILTAQQVQAHFDAEGAGYSVKVFVFDQLTYESGKTQVNLAEPILLQ